MFEAKLNDCIIFKKLIESIKDIINEASWDCSSKGMSLQAMDSSHVALVSIYLNCEWFKDYICTDNVVFGTNFGIMSKILKCASVEDSLTLRANDDSLSLYFESQSL